MRTIFYLPPLRKVSGGMRVIFQLASHLCDAGYETILAVNGDLPESLHLQKDLPIRQYNELKFQTEDRFIVPEGWPNALVPGLAAGSNCCVFAQNWAYMYGRLPDGVHWFNLPVKMLAISYPVAMFLKQTMGIVAPIISPALDFAFYPGENTAKQPLISKTASTVLTDSVYPKAGAISSGLRIAWMPRKNKGAARQIMNIVASMLALHAMPAPEWIEINNCSLSEVAAIMRSCQIFLATGYPEGFGLPPLEAMACGCIVAGFTGMGGWDYMRQANNDAFKPLFQLPATAWGANGFYAADGDNYGASLALFAAIKTTLKADSEYHGLIKNGLQTARFFSKERQKRQILSIWRDEEFWMR